MASQNRASVVSDIARATFCAKASMSDAHWEEIGAVLQRANEKRLGVVSQEPSVSPTRIQTAVLRKHGEFIRFST